MHYRDILAELRHKRTDFAAPVAAAHGDDLHLAIQDSATDGVGNFLAHLDAQTHVTICVPIPGP